MNNEDLKPRIVALEERVNDMSDDIRRLKGVVEILEFRVEGLVSALKTLVSY